ncbi:Dyp-type peroxidase, partial [Streptomyces sp. ND04-05B]|uniref:Dyp-type peroxidase domain-containing protein n=1 Tax=Streptomyces sp. ND04-05B TaxID=3028693 RepID=UPI0029BA9B7A
MADQDLVEGNAVTPDGRRGGDGSTARAGAGDGTGTGTGHVAGAGPAAGGAISRRLLLGTAGATGLALGTAGAAAGYAAGSSSVSGEKVTPLSSLGAGEERFHVKHQAGITTPLQARGHLIAFDLTAGAGRKEAAALLRRWSDTARRLMAGKPAAQDDTDIARDAGPSSLTVTFGFGHSFFART